jgi:hypothetical protein
VAASGEADGVEGLAAAVVFGTTLRAIGRGFGNGTFALAHASAADNPTASARLAPKVVHRIAVARANGVTALFPGESSNRGRPRSISLKLWTKY